MTVLNRLKCLNSLHLKLLAMALMLCDHMWATVIPGAAWMTSIGRLAFPIFAFQIAEGFARTHHFKGYLGRIFLFALISEIPFNLMYGGNVIYPFHQKVLFTFCLALLMLRLARAGAEKGGLWRYLTLGVACWLGYVLGQLSMVDYGGLGVLTVLLFWVCRELPFGWLAELAGLWIINGVLMGGMQFPISLGGLEFSFPQQGLAVLALLPIWMYNGRRGPGGRGFQYFCYAFYPVHILILAVLWIYIL